jgi:hypothetical protein
MTSCILAHFVGDYFLQTDFMAANKKKSSCVCLFHVVTYLVPFLLTPLLWWQIGLIGLQHFAQDRTNFVVWLMRVKGSEDFAKPPFAPWSIIVTDNILHILWIAFVAAM